MSFNLGTLIFDRTQSDVDAGKEKGFYNFSDADRVVNAVKYIRDILNGSGYIVEIKTKSWSAYAVPRQSDMVQYLDNVKTVADVIPYSFAPVPLPESMEKLTYVGANNIEKTLFDLGKAAESIEKNLFYAGMIESGVAYL